MIWADFCQFTVNALTRAALENEASSLASDLVARVVTFLEEAATSGDPEIENLVQVGFMEAMPQRGPARNAIVAQLGPKSAEFLTAAESY